MMTKSNCDGAQLHARRSGHTDSRALPCSSCEHHPTRTGPLPPRQPAAALAHFVVSTFHVAFLLMQSILATIAAAAAALVAARTAALIALHSRSGPHATQCRVNAVPAAVVMCSRGRSSRWIGGNPVPGRRHTHHRRRVIMGESLAW